MFLEFSINMETSDGMLIATILMAVFAGFSLVTSIVQAFVQTRLLKKQQISQENLLNKQNEIQQKQLQLALLKEKQEIRENFRNFVIKRRDALQDVVYKCKEMSLEKLRTCNSKDYVVFMRMGDLFGQDLRNKADNILRHFEAITSSRTNEISRYKLFENGVRHPERENKIKPDLLKVYRDVYNDNTHCLCEATKLFNAILRAMNKDIDQIAKNLQS